MNILKRSIIFLSIVSCICLGFFTTTPAQSSQVSVFSDYWQLIHSDKNGLSFSVHFPRPEFTIVTTRNKTYQQIVIGQLESFSEPGAPSIPAIRVPFFVPDDAEVSLKWQGQQLPLTMEFPPLPVPHRTLRESDDLVKELVYVHSENPDIYGCKEWYPEKPVRIDTDSYFRQARICTLLIEPLKVLLPEGRAIFYPDLRISVFFRTQPSKEKQDKVFTINDDHTALVPLYSSLAVNGPDLVHGRISMRSRAGNQNHHLSISSPKVVGDFYRVGIHETGMHCITYSDLDGAGFPVDLINPQHLALHKNSQETAILVIGEEDDIFNAGDMIVFYGIGVGNEYVNTNLYWLTDKGSNGLRMAQNDATVLEPHEEVTLFQESQTMEQNTVYWSNIPNGLGLDHWFWANHYIAPETRGYLCELQYPAGEGLVALSIALHGKSYSMVHNPDHHVRIEVNGVFIVEHSWDDQTPTIVEQDVDIATFQAGSNTITVDLDNGTGAPVDSIYMNYIDITYPRQFITDSDELSFQLTGIGSQRVVVQGFSNDDISVYDVSDPQSVSVLINTSIIEDTRSYSLVLGQDVSEPHSYISLCFAQLKSVDFITLDEPSDLRNTANGADLIIVAPVSFHNALQPLVIHRQNQGYRVALVDIQNVYDEFSDGLLSPQALIDFFQYAYDVWQTPPPLGLLLVGEANVDYHNYLGSTVQNIVPTALIEVLGLGQTISDHVYTLVSGSDDLPDIFLGRVTASTRNEVKEFVAKVIGYETQTVYLDWNNNVLLVADSYPIYENYLDTLQAPYFDPAGMMTHKVYLSTYGSNVSQAKQDIITNINTGRLFCFYLGHGAFENWSGQFLLVNGDIDSFTNGAKQAILVSSTCLNGYFGHHTVEKSMSEEWLRHQMKGAVITSSSTAITSEHDCNKFHHRLLEQVLTNNETKAGLAIFGAEILAYINDAMSIYHLRSMSVLGDPVTIIRLPGSTPEALMSFDQDHYYTETAAAVLTVWDTDANTDSFSVDTITLLVISQSDILGLSLLLVETGNNTGIFTSDDPSTHNLTFSLLGTVPSQGILLVADGDWIQALYQNGSPLQTHVTNATWFLAETPTLSRHGIIILSMLFTLLFIVHRKHTIVE